MGFFSAILCLLLLHFVSFTSFSFQLVSIVCLFVLQENHISGFKTLVILSKLSTKNYKASGTELSAWHVIAEIRTLLSEIYQVLKGAKKQNKPLLFIVVKFTPSHHHKIKEKKDLLMLKGNFTKRLKTVV